MSRPKERSNARLAVRPEMVARLFADTNLVGQSRLEAESILLAISAGDYGGAKKLCDVFARPEFRSCPSYYTRKQFTALVSKVPFSGDNRARKRRAQISFDEAELRCKRVNKKLSHFDKHPNRMPEVIRVLLARARGRISRVLGVLTEAKLAKIISLARPGSGVSIGTRNRFRVSLPFKLGDTDLAVTQRALPYARMMVEGSPAWFRLHAEVDWEARTYTVPYVTAESNRITYVPKDARTLRTIAIEPSLNVCLQLGVHSYLADKLEILGNSITDQSRNQQYAREASVKGFGSSYATIDLSQASDSVSIELVRLLLPSDWFSFLDDLRCESGEVEGAVRTYHKFSSMGNGFTFALETLIFWALGEACNSLTGGGVNSTYGDDIIISDCSAALLLELLRFCGFVVNDDKSFVIGDFRESCGADWHYGYRVTPQYLRTAVLRPTDVYSLLNRGDPVFNWSAVRQYLLAEHRKVEPVLYGLENEDTSACLFAPFPYVKGGGGLRWKPEWQTWTYRGWVFKPESEKVPVMSALAASLFGARGLGTRYQLRGRGVFRLRYFTPGVTRGLPGFYSHS